MKRQRQRILKKVRNYAIDFERPYISNPLGDIRGVAQLAANDPDLNEDVCHDLGKIVKSMLYAREIKKVCISADKRIQRKPRPILTS